MTSAERGESTGTPSALNEYSQAEEPARILLERLKWTYVPRGAWRRIEAMSERYPWRSGCGWVGIHCV